MLIANMADDGAAMFADLRRWLTEQGGPTGTGKERWEVFAARPPPREDFAKH